MTADQRNYISRFYEEAVAEAKKYLKDRFKLQENVRCRSELARKFPKSLIWQIVVQSSGKEFSLLVFIPPIFPDELPKIYLNDNEFRVLELTPHVDSAGFICTRESGKSVIDDLQPGQAIEALLKIAVSILEAKFSPKGTAEYFDEFLAYWNDDSNLTALLLEVPETFPSIWVQYKFDPMPRFAAQTVIGSSIESINQWLQRANLKGNVVFEGEVLCIQLPGYPHPVPKRNINIRTLLRSIAAAEQQAVQKFQGRTILAVIGQCPNQVVFIWRHKNEKVKGFRNKKISLAQLLAGNPLSEVHRVKTIRTDPLRIYRRAMGAGMNVVNNKSVSMIGIGALGSEITMLLAKQGITHFMLIDMDELGEENIARHLCGMSYVGSNLSKVDAVSSIISSHLPFVKFEPIKQNVLRLLAEGKGVLRDLSVCAVADWAVERRLNEYSYETLKGPVVYIWMESYGVGGHLLYINPTREGCINCCFEEAAFQYSILADLGKPSEKERGCQSSFTPFGAADIAIFCGIASRQICRMLDSPESFNYILTWTGDIDAAKKQGIGISDSYRSFPAYSVVVRKIDRSPECSICQK